MATQETMHRIETRPSGTGVFRRSIILSTDCPTPRYFARWVLPENVAGAPKLIAKWNCPHPQGQAQNETPNNLRPLPPSF